MPTKLIFLTLFFVLSLSHTALAQTVILQGNPIILTIDGANKIPDVKSASFNNKTVPVFLYNGKPTVLIGIDLNQKPGNYDFVAKLVNGSEFKQTITVELREKPREVLGIPEKLGGNTKQAQTVMVSSLSSENAVLAKIHTGLKAFWIKPFQYPLSTTTVTDSYGYIRETGNYLIAHKGVDFRASEGTPVNAMNRGVVRLAKNFKIYGKTIVVDHGLGVMTMYMHLSRIKVNVGELVLPGQVIGLSGKTGYAEDPHLHISIRIGGISIDPIKFLSLFAE